MKEIEVPCTDSDTLSKLSKLVASKKAKRSYYANDCFYFSVDKNAIKNIYG